MKVKLVAMKLQAAEWIGLRAWRYLKAPLVDVDTLPPKRARANARITRGVLGSYGQDFGEAGPITIPRWRIVFYPNSGDLRESYGTLLAALATVDANLRGFGEGQDPTHTQYCREALQRAAAEVAGLSVREVESKAQSRKFCDYAIAHAIANELLEGDADEAFAYLVSADAEHDGQRDATEAYVEDGEPEPAEQVPRHATIASLDGVFATGRLDEDFPYR